jgi:hypothetical protein
MPRQQQISIFFACLIYALLSLCQPAQAVDQDIEIWAPVILDTPAKNNISARLEVMPRWNNSAGSFQLIMVRPSVAYQRYFENSQTFMELRGGGMWISYVDERINEYRPWQQVVLVKNLEKLNDLKLIYRQRNELRFFEGAGQGSPSLRNRHLLGLSYPITERTNVVIFDELMVNLLKNRLQPTGFTQNRWYIGLDRVLTKNITAKAGYLLSWINRAEPEANDLNHGIVLQLHIHP